MGDGRADCFDRHNQDICAAAMGKTSTGRRSVDRAAGADGRDGAVLADQARAGGLVGQHYQQEPLLQNAAPTS